MKSPLIYCLTIIIVFTASVNGQVVIKGVTSPESIKEENHTLVLNGAGVRKKGPIDLYVAALYLLTKNKDAAKIIEAAEPMAMRIVILSKRITSEKMDKTMREGFVKSTKGNTSPFQDRIDAFSKALSEDISKGASYDLVFLPDKDMVRVLKDGKMKTEIKGLDFKKVLFAIWLGDEPVDKDLKKNLLAEELAAR
jgi:hypothetical protein